MEYSRLKHFEFSEGHVMDALNELRQPWLAKAVEGYRGS